ncbi:hypothetical protein [Luedemannella helvata]
MGKRLLPKTGVVVDERPDAVSVLGKGGTVTLVPPAQLDAFPQVIVPSPPVFGAAGRLWAVSLARQSGAVKGGWAVDTVDAAAMTWASSSLGARRAAALDLIALGLGTRAAELQLSASELTWYRSWHAAAAGDLHTLVSCLESLPPDGYAARVLLLARLAAPLQADPALAQRACVLLRPFVATSTDAEALHAALRNAPAANTIELTQSFAGLVERAGAMAAGTLTAVPSAISGSQRLPALPPIPVPALRSLDAYLAGMAGMSLNAAVPFLAALPAELLDELIDRGALTRLPAGGGPLPASLTAYVRARTEPGSASVEELQAIGFTAERARRAFLAGDDATLRELPADDPDARHYRALREFVRTGHITDPDALRPDARAVLQLVERLREEPGEIPDEIAADASCWPLLRDPALRGDLVIGAEQRAKYPELGAWIDLCQLQRLVFEARWGEVIAAGRRLVHTTRLERVSDEAQNMVAYAEWQQGSAGEALRVLNEALSGQFTNGLVVNAALVAAEQGCLPALPYLTQAMRLATDPRVRQGAVSRAVSLWLADDTVPDYPEPLALLVREALAQPQADDDFYATILNVLAAHDHDWLAKGTLRPHEATQQDALRYFITKARMITDGYDDQIEDVARVLANLWKATPHPPWLERERTWIAGLLMEVVHTEFGKAAGVAGTIDVLIDGGVLTLKEELVLGIQAGAHVCFRISDDGNEIAEHAEQQLIFERARRFRARQGELTDAERTYVAGETARCVCMAMLAFAISAERAWQAFAEQWDQLVQRERWDHQNRYAIVQLERRALDEFERYIVRCRAYLNALRDFTLDEPLVEQRDLVAARANEWATETARLRSML